MSRELDCDSLLEANDAMKLQIALDEFDIDGAIALVEEVANYIDIIEAGTPFIVHYGMEAVRILRERFPDKEVLADVKIVDGGYAEACMAFDAGADYCTVLGLADNSTISEVVRAGRRYRTKVVADLICVEDLEGRCREVSTLGVDMLSIHTAVDQQAHGRTPLGDLRRVKTAMKDDVSIEVAGGINASTVGSYVRLHPDIVVVGGGIAHATDRVRAACSIKSQLEQGNQNAYLD